MGKDLKKGNWFENQEEIADKVKGLNSNGNLEGLYDEPTLVSNDSLVGKVSIELDRGSVEITADPVQQSIKIINIPTSDPNIENVLWSNSGVLTISAG